MHSFVDLHVSEFVNTNASISKHPNVKKNTYKQELHVSSPREKNYDRFTRQRIQNQKRNARWMSGDLDMSRYKESRRGGGVIYGPAARWRSGFRRSFFFLHSSCSVFDFAFLLLASPRFELEIGISIIGTIIVMIIVFGFVIINVITNFTVIIIMTSLCLSLLVEVVVALLVVVVIEISLLLLMLTFLLISSLFLLFLVVVVALSSFPYHSLYSLSFFS